MRYLQYAMLLVMALGICANAQERRVKVESVDNYQGWGWNALKMENGLISLATVPSIGARIMQYDLGEHRSIFVNEDELGKLYEPGGSSPWHNYGGYKVWPAPQDRWGWPPPPSLDFGLYEGTVETVTPDSATVFVSGPVEQWKTPGLRLERRTTIFRGSSRVRVEQTIINEGDKADRWSVWDVTQQIVNHPGERDFENFWVYFPIDPDSRYGSRGGRVSKESEAWKGEVAPGIFGVQYLPEGKKIFADSPQGWVCYVDEREGYAYAKTFALAAGEEYPDQGANVEVWLNSDPLLYLEVEVLSPIVELAPNGGRYTFTEDWWAARVHGPILEVNQVGALAGRLHIADGVLSVSAGVFHEGKAQVVFVGGDGSILRKGQVHAVTPLETFILREDVTVPEGAVRAELRVSDPEGVLIGVLDAVELPRSTEVKEDGEVFLPRRSFLGQSYPNPFNASVAIEYAAPAGSPGRTELAVFNVTGERIRTLVGNAHRSGERRAIWDGRDEQGREVASGVYLYQLRTAEMTRTKRMVLVR